VGEEPEHPLEVPETMNSALEDSADLPGIPDALFNFAEYILEPSSHQARKSRKAPSGNPQITAVHHTGVFELEVLHCICPNASDSDEQLLRAQMFPASFKNTETVFTISVLDDFLTDNLECKTTAQQYFSKLQSITNRMFPDAVPVCVIN
jgi:hypothetical protein